MIYNNEIASATTLSVTSAYGNTLSSYGANVKTIDASTKSKAIKITGNAKNNSIVGSAKNDTIDGGAGADVIQGGKGNDVLTGGAGDDIFIYTDGDGKDTITDYSAGDVISLSGDYNISYSYSSAKGGTSTFKIGKSGSIAVKNSANAVVTLVGANGEASIGIKNSFLAVSDIPGFSPGSGTNETVYVTVPAETVNVTLPAETITVGGGDTITVTVEAEPVTISGGIPQDAFEYNGHSYYIYSNVVDTWDAAKTYAESLGGYLAIINNDAENTALYDYMKSRGYGSAYFGFTDAPVEGTWNWVDGSSVNYTNWASGEPSNGVNNNAGRENYGMFYWMFRYTWNDGDFGDIFNDNGSQAFIVEWNSASNTTQGVTFNSGSTAATITSDYKKMNFAASNYSSLSTIDASARKSINLIGNANDNVIIGGIENDTLTGGKGNDTFVYSGGSDFDIIADYTESEDKISIGANAVIGGMVVGNDVIFSIGNGGIKLTGAKDKAVTIISGDTETEYVNGAISSNDTDTGTGGSDTGSGGGDMPSVDYNGVTVTLEADRNTNFSLSAYNSTVSVAAVNVDGSLVRNSIRINGDDNANILRGTRANTTINAGKGNDVIYCGEGYDTIQYTTGDGNDVIYNYKTGDYIRF